MLAVCTDVGVDETGAQDVVLEPSSVERALNGST